MSEQTGLCARCDAVCCRPTVVLQAEDRVPPHLAACANAGLHVMARDAEGRCVAVDAAHMRCSIYGSRAGLQAIRHVGPYRREVRGHHADRTARGIPLTMY